MSLSNPEVSIVIPCRNEEVYISRCLDSVIASDFPNEQMEVLVVDGMSEDGTRSILNTYQQQYPFIRMIDNEKRITPVAFNLGIKQAKGELLMIMSAHATYDPKAISICVTRSSEYQADNVGGVWKVHPRNSTLIDRATVEVLSHRFGVGDATYRTISEADHTPQWVDTAAYGCYRKEVFERIGYFNENLVRGQDMELNLRLKDAGGKTLLAPDAVIHYYARSSFSVFCKHNFRNGVWALVPFCYSAIMPVSLRHLIPLAFVFGLISTLMLSPFSVVGLWLFLGISGAYMLLDILASIQISSKEKEWKFLAVLPFIFPSLHIAYGIGSLVGLVKVIGCVLSPQKN